MTKLVGVIVRQGRAYIPTTARTPKGLMVAINPIYTVECNLENLVQIMERMEVVGNPQIADLDWEAFHRHDPTLQAAKVRSWKELAQGGASYTIEWLPGEEITLYTSMLDKRGRFVDDPAKTRTFPPNTPTSVVVGAIWSDICSRPELGCAGGAE